jgi:hypothetical protein
MDESSIHAAMSAARQCALTMLESALFIARELPALRLSDALRKQVQEACGGLTATKHDIDTEVEELWELLATGAGQPAAARRLERMHRWLGEDVARMHTLVTALEEASSQDAALSAAYVLVAESAVNILESFERAGDAIRLVAGSSSAGSGP